MKPVDHYDTNILEQYALGQHEESAVVSLEEHLLVCACCRAELEKADLFVAAVRMAAGQLRESKVASSGCSS